MHCSQQRAAAKGPLKEEHSGATTRLASSELGSETPKIIDLASAVIELLPRLQAIVVRLKQQPLGAQ